MTKHLYLLIPLLAWMPAAAQQSSLYLQAAEECGLDNPAGLSIEEIRHPGMTVNLYSRNQWWIQPAAGQPQTQTLTWLYNSPERYHVGAMLLADKIGETRQFGLAGRYAHTLLPGVKLGVSAGIYTHRVLVGELYQLDLNDPLAQSGGDTRFRLAVSSGLFYHLYNKERVWNWFAGLSYRRAFFLNRLPGLETPPPETDILAHAGLRRNTWWLGSRWRFSVAQPGAIDLYLRKYLREKHDFYVGGIFTADRDGRTAGIQAGYERELNRQKAVNNHYLTVSLGFSKPLSKYVGNGNLIFDGRATWTLRRKESNDIVPVPL